ncbi:MAG: hypothetical protein KAS71_00690 [Bacteroidales bacterium]|nr:hypothetical protein [Bacteroidales bacterium]
MMRVFAYLILLMSGMWFGMLSCSENQLEFEDQIEDFVGDTVAYAIITSPENGASFNEGDTITVKVEAGHSLGYDSVSLWIDDIYHNTVLKDSYAFTIADLSTGDHNLEAIAHVNADSFIRSEKNTIHVNKSLSDSPSYNGSIIGGDQVTRTIYLFEGDKTDLNNSVLWSWNASEATGIDSGDDLAGGPVDIKWVMGGTHILAIMSPYVALIRIENKHVVFYGKAAGNPHSCELLPDGNIVTASSDGKMLKIFYTGGGNKPTPYEYPFGGAHGVVWDHKRQVLWAIGGDKLWSFIYNFDRQNPSLTAKDKYVIEPSGHDLYPVPGEDKLYFTSKNLWVFDIATGEQTVLLDKGPKSVSQNGPNGEIIYTQGMGGNAAELGLKKWQTPHIKSLNGSTRTYEGAGFYKVRWFIPCPFSYKEWDH